MKKLHGDSYFLFREYFAIEWIDRVREMQSTIELVLVNLYVLILKKPQLDLLLEHFAAM